MVVAVAVSLASKEAWARAAAEEAQARIVASEEAQERAAAEEAQARAAAEDCALQLCRTVTAEAAMTVAVVAAATTAAAAKVRWLAQHAAELHHSTQRSVPSCWALARQ